VVVGGEDDADLELERPGFDGYSDGSAGVEKEAGAFTRPLLTRT